MFCPYCGARQPEQAAFCPYCGSPGPARDAAQPTAASSSHAPSGGTEQGRRHDARPRAGSQSGHQPPDPRQEHLAAGHAGFWKRFLAWCIDYPLAMLLVALLSFVEGFALELMDVSGEIIGNLAFFLGILVPWLYFALCQSSPWQATPGKMALGVIVTDMQGRRIGFLRATGRYFGKYLSALLLLFGFIMAGFTPQKQALHDLMARTLVENRQRS